MTDNEIIEQFENTWFYNRKMSMEFFEVIPADKWHYTHNPKFSTLSKQFSHMVRVYGVYLDGLQNQAVDFSKKPMHYSGPLEKEPLRIAFAAMDERCRNILSTLKDTGIAQFRLNFFGMNMNFNEYTHLMIQHESMHIGMWSTYAAFGGFELPELWKQEWGF